MTFGELVDTVAAEDFLVSEFRRGKTRAFEQIFLKHHGAICYFTAEFIYDGEAAKDIVSEVFVKLWHLRENFENVKAIKAFLYVSAKNACLNYLRRARLVTSHQKTALLELSKEEIEDIVMKQIFDAEVIREVYKAIEALPTQCKRIVRLTLQGLNTEEIANMMSISVQTVRNTRNRATHLLRQQLSGGTLAVALVASVVDVVKPV
ncbi:RNA polymerase sigma-70 factor [Dinghuibacter silviterrae]|uniref:RNA polymerase sigma-70 factor (ECF subfamily) n=1 Tax=Dinghuibacter silviterrae TaxID=1539049 RepID=A0A4R8DX82_9BACT|nr:RNA polymerase sigma-70 factor [Dinghuibacter silviterrae]TDX01821.1 RNA polymerase sigma-70 factor (ECF subfamily) [Dinghuibacter silviterrae]